jgi:hypothetical protein
MARTVGSVVSACGLAIGVLGLMVCAWATSLARVDAVTFAAFVAGLAVSIVGYARGSSTAARRLAVLGIGCNALGFLLVMLPYAVG